VPAPLIMAWGNRLRGISAARCRAAFRRETGKVMTDPAPSRAVTIVDAHLLAIQNQAHARYIEFLTVSRLYVYRQTSTPRPTRTEQCEAGGTHLETSIAYRRSPAGPPRHPRLGRCCGSAERGGQLHVDVIRILERQDRDPCVG
jgi:hypothetical protein